MLGCFFLTLTFTDPQNASMYANCTVVGWWSALLSAIQKRLQSTAVSYSLDGMKRALINPYSDSECVLPLHEIWEPAPL